MASDPETHRRQVHKYSRQELIYLQIAPSTRATLPPVLPDSIPLREKTGSRARPFDVNCYLGPQDDIDMVVSLSENFEEFETFLNLAFLPIDVIEKLLKVLHRVLACELQGEFTLKTLQAVCSTQFLHLHLRNFAKHLQRCSRDEVAYSPQTMKEVLQQTMTLLSSICDKLPSEKSKVTSLMSYVQSQGDLMKAILKTPGCADSVEQLLSDSKRRLTSQRQFPEAGCKKEGHKYYCQNVHDEE